MIYLMFWKPVIPQVRIPSQVTPQVWISSRQSLGDNSSGHSLGSRWIYKRSSRAGGTLSSLRYKGDTGPGYHCWHTAGTAPFLLFLSCDERMGKITDHPLTMECTALWRSKSTSRRRIIIPCSTLVRVEWIFLKIGFYSRINRESIRGHVQSPPTFLWNN